MMNKTLVYHTQINAPLSTVFDFFSRAENLNHLTPPEVHFEFLSPLPIEMFQGRLILYKIKIFGIPFKWKTRVTNWSPPSQFVDFQESGPYAIWEHTHYFEEKDGKTNMRDTIVYRSKGWILAPFLHWLFVDRKVKEIFAYREQKLHEIFRTN